MGEGRGFFGALPIFHTSKNGAGVHVHRMVDICLIQPKRGGIALSTCAGSSSKL
jgi:hypothetical protein